MNIKCLLILNFLIGIIIVNIICILHLTVSKESPWYYLRNNKGFKALMAQDPYCLEISGIAPCASQQGDLTRLEFREIFTDDFLKENNRFISPGPIELPSGSFMNVMAGMFAPHPTPPPPPLPLIVMKLYQNNQ